MISKTDISVISRDGKTYLQNAYFTPPFKVANVTEGGQGKWINLMLMSSSPGILDGDEYELNITLEECANLHLQTQSYQRIYRMEAGATQHVTVQMKSGSSLIFLPHPIVPHENSIFHGRNKIYLTAGCQLIWGEIITCGRRLNNEVFRLSSYHSITEIFYNQKLLIKENMLLAPMQKNPSAIGQLEKFTHQASFICVNGNLPAANAITEVLEFLSTEEEIEYGATLLSDKGILVRILGFHAEQLHACLNKISQLISEIKISEVVHAD